MGYDVAGALGIKLAAPEREVYALLGDSSYLMVHTESVTAVQEGRKITLVLADNRAFGCIHPLQRGQRGRGLGGNASGGARAGMIGINVGVPAPMSMFPFSGSGESFFGDLHMQGRSGVHFYTQPKATTTRWFRVGEGDIWRK